MSPQSAGHSAGQLARLLAAFLLVFAGAGAAQRGPRAWDAADKVLLGTYAGVLALDVGQTHYALRHDETLQESNPFLGTRPSDAHLLLYNAAMLGGIAWVASRLPSEPWRKLLLGAFVAYEALTVRNNLRLGASLHLW